MTESIRKEKYPWVVDFEFHQPITKAETVPAYEGLEPYARPTIRAGEPIRFSVNAIVEPTDLQGKRGFIVSPGPGWSNFEIYCDEGTAMGGQDLAPSPLGYLTSAIGFCLLTHITGYLHHSPLQIDKIKVEVRGEFWTRRPTAGDGGQGAGGCDSFQVHVIMDSQEPPEKIAGLVQVCRNACMAIQTVANAIPTSIRLLLNGQDHPLQ